MKVLVVDYSSIRESAIHDARLERDQHNRNRLDRDMTPAKVLCKGCKNCNGEGSHHVNVIESGDDRVVIGYRNGSWLSVYRSLTDSEALDVVRHGS